MRAFCMGIYSQGPVVASLTPLGARLVFGRSWSPTLAHSISIKSLISSHIIGRSWRGANAVGMDSPAVAMSLANIWWTKSHDINRDHTRLHHDSLATSASDLRWNRPCYDRILDRVASSFARQWSHNFCDCFWQSKTLAKPSRPVASEWECARSLLRQWRPYWDTFWYRWWVTTIIATKP